MRIDIITALPELLTGPLDHSIVGRARTAGVVDVQVHDLRQYSTNKYKKVDDYPYGGSAGMVMTPDPIFACIEALVSQGPVDDVIFLTPDGERLTQGLSNQLSLSRRIILLAGHYKGVDQRVRDVLITREISIGDYVLSGGELPAAVLVDSIVRLIPGAIGDSTSALSDSFQDGLLDAPVYTRPAVYRGMAVPDVLRSGDHARIEEWTEQQKHEKTRRIRPDMIDQLDNQTKIGNVGSKVSKKS